MAARDFFRLGWLWLFDAGLRGDDFDSDTIGKLRQ